MRHHRAGANRARRVRRHQGRFRPRMSRLRPARRSIRMRRPANRVAVAVVAVAIAVRMRPMPRAKTAARRTWRARHPRRRVRLHLRQRNLRCWVASSAAWAASSSVLRRGTDESFEKPPSSPRLQRCCPGSIRLCPSSRRTPGSSADSRFFFEFRRRAAKQRHWIPACAGMTVPRIRRS